MGKKNVDEVGFEPTTSCNGVQHELAKQARYHCAIRPMIDFVEVKNTYGRSFVRHSPICSTLPSHQLENDDAGESTNVTYGSPDTT